MFCSKCGKEIDDAAVVCTGCGCPTQNYKKESQPAQPVNYGVSAQPVIDFEKESYLKQVNTAYVLAIVSVVLCLGIGIIFAVIASIMVSKLPTVTWNDNAYETAQRVAAQNKIATVRKLIIIPFVVFSLALFGFMFAMLFAILS